MGRVARLLLGGLVGVAGLTVVGVGTRVIPSDPESLHAPQWVMVAAGGMFAVVGAWIVSAGTRVGEYLGYMVAPLVLTVLLSIAHWVAFGPGARQCSGGIEIPFVSTWRVAGDLECRVAFGYGAVLLDGVLASIGLSTLAERHLEGVPRQLTDVSSKVILVIALAPILVLMVALLAPFQLFKAAWSKLTG